MCENLILFKDASTLVDILRLRAMKDSDRTAFTFLSDGEDAEESITYAGLDKKARVIASFIQNMDICGKRVLLLYPPGMEYIAAFFGCLYGGAVAVPSYPPRLNKPDLRLKSIIEDSQASIALTTSEILSNLKARSVHNPEMEKLQWVATDNITEDLSNTWERPAVDGNTIAFLQYTSGSTSVPKGVMVSHSNLIYNLNLMRVCFGQTQETRGVLWLPPYHDMGLIGGILQPLNSGYPMVLMAPVAFTEKPFRWLNAITKYKANTSGGPNFAFDLCVQKISDEQKALLDLSSWDVAFNGAEPIRSETLKKFYDCFKECGFRWEAFHPCYGLAEGTLVVSTGKKLEPPIIKNFKAESLEERHAEETNHTREDSKSLVSCGTDIPGQKIRIVNTSNLTSCPNYQVGEVWVSGPSIAKGYWNRIKESNETFNAYLEDTGEGPFLRTGDLGFLDGSQLYITGRVKDLIVIRGRNHYPQDIELTVERSHPSMQSNSGAAFSISKSGEEQLVVVQELKRSYRKADIDEVAKSVRKSVSEIHGLQIYDLALLKPASLPKTSSGKIQRQLCRKMYLDGTLQIIGSSILEHETADFSKPDIDKESFISKALKAVPDFSIKKQLLSIYLKEQISRIIRVDAGHMDLDTPIISFGIDSISSVELIHEIELSLGVSISMSFLLEGASIEKLSTDILEKLDNIENVDSSKYDSEDIEEKQQLSYGQRALWFLHNLSGNSAAYNISRSAKIKAPIEVNAIKNAFQKLSDRHSSLNSTFIKDQGELLQYARKNNKVFFRYEDTCEWDELKLEKTLEYNADSSFDLSLGPLFKVFLYKRGEDEYVLQVIMHHIIGDFWSLAVIMKEIEALYEAELKGEAASLPLIKSSYSNYIKYQNELLAGDVGRKMASYWKQKLSGELPVLNLQTDKPRPPVQTYRGASETLILDAGLAGELNDFSRNNGATLYMTLLAAFKVLLHRYTNQNDILVGSPTSGRSRAEFSKLVGYFVNTIVLRDEISGNMKFEEFLEQVRKTVLEAFEHQEYPFSMLVEQVCPQRDLGRTPLFQAMFTLQQSPFSDMEELASFAAGGVTERLGLKNLPMEALTLKQTAAQFDIALVVAETAKNIVCTLEYSSDIFEAETIRNMLVHFKTLLKGIVSKSGCSIGELPLLTEEEKIKILDKWNDTAEKYDNSKCIHHLFEAQVLKTPLKTAVIFEDMNLSYDELNHRANCLAGYLYKSGVGPGVGVGIFMERSLEMLVAILGVLKAGGTYIPIDPVYPEERISFVLQDSQVPFILTQEKLRRQIKNIKNFGIKEQNIVCVDLLDGELARENGKNLETVMSSSKLAYIIFTSGSTGRPKGVQISHKAVVNFLNSMRRKLAISEKDIWFAVTTLSFDISVLELFLPLITGASIMLASRETVNDGRRMSRLLDKTGSTFMQATPSTWRILLESGWKGNKNLKSLCGGEALPGDLANMILDKTGSLWNMYGPTETTVWSTMYQVKKGEGTVLIGRPIDNTRIYILDKYLNPVPVGVAGDLYIGGDGLANGYLNRPELTAERFVPDPCTSKPNTLMYKTGDLARYRADGNIEYLGRTDHQVKIRGYRIELGEIETVLNSYPMVQSTIVTVREVGPGDKRLVAYIAGQNTGKLNISVLRQFLKEKIPEYMIPSSFILMDSFPLLPNGKINRNALPEPKELSEQPKENFVLPQSHLEQRIADVWKRVLLIDKVGIHDNFFELGGHSLLMSKIQVILQEEGIISDEISVVELFQYPTVHSLANHIENRNLSEPDSGRIEVRENRQKAVNSQRELRKMIRGGE